MRALFDWDGGGTAKSQKSLLRRLGCLTGASRHLPVSKLCISEQLRGEDSQRQGAFEIYLPGGRWKC